MKYLSLAGNIGAGKSTLASELSRATGAALVTEPVADNPFLHSFYRDPRQWAFRLQMFNLASRAQSIKDSTDSESFVLDRSFEEDIVYVRVAHEDGLVTDDEFSVYTKLYHLLLDSLPTPSMLFYLRIDDPQELLRRILIRGREMEAAITLDYLSRLQSHYDAWFDGYRGRKRLVNGMGFELSGLINEFLVEDSPPTT